MNPWKLPASCKSAAVDDVESGLQGFFLIVLSGLSGALLMSSYFLPNGLGHSGETSAETVAVVASFLEAAEKSTKTDGLFPSLKDAMAPEAKKTVSRNVLANM